MLKRVDLNINNLINFLNQLPDNALINGKSASYGCIALYSISIIENIPVDKFITVGKYILYKSNGYIDCDFSVLQYWQPTSTRPDLIQVLPDWVKEFSIRETHLGIAPVWQFIDLLIELKGKYGK